MTVAAPGSACGGGRMMLAAGPVWTRRPACSGRWYRMRPAGERVRVRMGISSGEAAQTAAALAGLNNLPAQVSSFIGRDAELAEVRRLVGASRLVTLTGAGGAGKTRLALHVAADLLDGAGEGVWFADL